MRIQYISDIHLEFYDEKETIRLLRNIEPQTNICVLAGDIGYPFQRTYKIFLCGMSKKFEHIFLIHGNHEYYQFSENRNKTMKEIYDKTNRIIEKNNLQNIHFLHNSNYDLDEYRFIGSILWTKIEDPNYLSNDYNKIYEASIDELNEMHENNKIYINGAIEEANNLNKKVIMITHHLPSYKLNHPKYARYYRYHQCFSSHSDNLIRDPVKLWIFGHTHSNIEMNINNIPCVCNPLGYPDENNDIDLNKIIEI